MSRLSATASTSNVNSTVTLGEAANAKNLPDVTTTSALRHPVLASPAVVLDLLDARAFRNAVEPPLIQAHVSRLIIRIEHGFQEECLVHQLHRKVIVGVLAGYRLGRNHRGPIKLLIAIVVLGDFKNVV
jgi:hypothetical protein